MRSAKRSTHLLILLLLLAFFAQGMAHLRSASLTFDEGPHLATGYATLRTGDFRLQPVHIHPPLANILSAMLLLLQDDLPDPRTIDGWDIASLSAVTDAVVWQYPHPERLALVGRLPILWLAVLLGALICRWARDLGGPRAGLLALTLFAFDPNMIAHGTLITTDMAATMLSVATLYAASRQVGEKAKKRKSEKAERQGSENFVGWMGVGVLLGLALLAKVSSLMLVPVLGLVIAGHEWRMANGEFHGSRFTQYILRLIPYAASLALPAMLVVWAGYGFEVGQVPGLPFPIPAATHVRIYQSLQEHYELGHPTFLLGQVSSHGWWWYFPVAFVLKTPLPMLLLALYAVVCAAYRVRRDVLTHSTHALRSTHYVVLLFPLLYAATSLFSTVNIGYRHLLPLLPFLYIGVANCKLQVATSKSRASHFTFHALRITHYALLLWLILGTLAVAPHDLAFFNELAGGPAGGYRYLVDSNLDWGQNLWQLREWMTEHDVTEVYYAHYSPARPQAYGIEVKFLPPDPRAVTFTPWQPAPGWYAIGATVLQGPYAPDLNFYAWFRNREPAARLGHALWLYEVAPSSPPAWAVLCAETGLSSEQVRANVGQATLRVIRPDCSSAEVYAKGTGLWVGTAAERPTAGTLEFSLRAANGAESARIERLEAAPSPASPYPVQTAGPLDFLGYDVTPRPESSEIVLRTYWQVKERPDRPLSLMAHLVAADGTTVQVGDGMGFPIDQWQTGDMLIQQHRLPAPESEGYAFRLGGYWLDTMERWPIVNGGDYWEVRP
ncbi:MAG TPA: glycosyltransferase family 39 protein [Anaerolineae bacterium]|nr:glycosyltransferase family 39 protein [Anaerolineae bacterium]